jgi:hypothetical protein
MIEQPVGIVEGRPQHLSARRILEGGGDAPVDAHGRRVDRLRCAKTRGGGAKGAYQKDRLDQVAARLLDGERRKLAVIERALAGRAGGGELSAALTFASA